MGNQVKLCSLKLSILNTTQRGLTLNFISHLTNVGPIAEDVATEAGHAVFDLETKTFHLVGGA